MHFICAYVQVLEHSKVEWTAKLQDHVTEITITKESLQKEQAKNKELEVRLLCFVCRLQLEVGSWHFCDLYL